MKQYLFCRYPHFFATLLLVWLSCQSSTVQAQPEQIDSLARLIAAARTDTARIRLTNQQIQLISTQNLDSAIWYGQRNLKAAQRLHYYEGEVAARNQLITNYCYTGNLVAARQALQQQQAFVQPVHDSADFAKVYSHWGMIHGMESQYDSSILFYNKALRIEERNKDSTALAKIYTNLGSCYQYLGSFATALQYMQQAMRIAEKRNDEYRQAQAQLNMGNIYEQTGDTVRARMAYQKVATLAGRSNLPSIEVYAYSNLAHLYMRLGRWQMGYQYALQAAEKARQTGNAAMHASNLAKAATCLANQAAYSRAHQLAGEAIRISDSVQQPMSIADAQEAMGVTMYLQQRYREALPYFERCVRVMRETDIYDESTSEICIQLSDCYEHTGNYVKALETYKLGAQMADSVKRKDNIRRTTELSMTYDFDKKQEIQAAEARKNAAIARTRQLALLAGLLFVLVLIVLVLIGYRNKQRANRVLRQQKEQTEAALTELKATQAQLIQAEKMASLGELTAGIAHEIQNPLNFVNNFSELGLELIEEWQEEMQHNNQPAAETIAADLRQNMEKIHQHGKRADAIVKGMLQHARHTGGSKAPTDINALCDEFLRLSYHGVRAKNKDLNVGLQTDFDPTVGTIQVVAADIGRVLLNLFNNALYAVAEKRTQAGNEYQPSIKVSTARRKDSIDISVADNGNGIPAAIQGKIFQPFFTTKPTGQGTGLGLSLSYDIITKEHNGNISVASTEGAGTTFLIRLPVQA